MSHSDAVAVKLIERNGARVRDWFFLGMAGVLLLLVLVGFSPTYYLRSQFGATFPELPGHLYLHGAILTLWFVIAFIQPLLVVSGNASVHRQIGLVGASAAVALVLVTASVLVRAIARPPLNVPEEVLPIVIVGDAFALVVFSVLITTGISLRGNREAHKRLMLLGSIAVVSPAISRLPGVIELPFLTAIGQLALLAAVIAHDWRRERRVHPATSFGVVLIIAGVVAGVIVGSSPLGRALMERLA